MRRTPLAALALAVLFGGACSMNGMADGSSSAGRFKAQSISEVEADEDTPSAYELSKALRASPSVSIDASYNEVVDPMLGHVADVK